MTDGLARAFSTPGCAFGADLETYAELVEYEYFVRTVALFAVPCEKCANDKIRQQWIQGKRGAVWHTQIFGSNMKTAKVVNLYRCRACGCWSPPGFDGTSILGGRLQ